MSDAVAALTDASKKAAKEKFKQYLENRLGEKSKAINFMLEMFDVSIDLIRDSAKKGGIPSKGDIIRYFANKGAAFGILSGESKVACVSSLIGFSADVSKYEALAGGAIGVAAYLSFVAYDGLDSFENCDLAYKDYKADEQVKAFERKLRQQRTLKHARAVWEVQNRVPLAPAFAWAVENQCKSPDSYVRP
jgi:hypothetical protein